MRRLRDHRAVRIWLGIADQAFASLSNVLFLLAVARGATTTEFGAVSLGYAVVVFGLAIQRGTLGTLFAVGGPELRGVRAALLISLSWSGAVVAGGLLLSPLVEAAPAYFVVLASCFFVLPQDLLRYAAIASGETVVATISDGYWLLIAALLFAATAVWATLSALVITVLWLLFGAAPSLLVMLIAFRRHMRISSDWLRERSGELKVLIPHSALSAAAPLVLATVVAAALSIDDAAAIRGASTLIGPVSLLLAAIPLVLLPELQRISHDARATLVRIQSVLLVLVVASWGTAVYFIPEAVGYELLGPTWPLTNAIWLWVVAEYCSWALAAGYQSRLQTERQWRPLLWSRLFYLLCSVSLVAIGAWAGGLQHVMAGVALAGALNLIAIAFAARHAPELGRASFVRAEGK